MVRPAAQLRARLQRTAPGLLIALSVALIMLGKADEGLFASLRTAMSDDSAPVLAALSRPLDLASAAVERVRRIAQMYQDNQRLERDNARLLQWQQVAQKLADQNARLRKLLHAVPDKAPAFVTARVIGSAGGGFVRTLMVDAGSDQGAARGQAAIAGDGLVGRLTEVGARAARVLLITDLNSRIPVVVERSHENAILAGDNSDQPRLLYLKDPATAKVGDRVVTSGDGGVFPPGLPVGVVTAAAGGVPRLEPYARLSELDYVMIVDYGLAQGLPAPVAARAPRRGKGPAAAEASMR